MSKGMAENHHVQLQSPKNANTCPNKANVGQKTETKKNETNITLSPTSPQICIHTYIHVYVCMCIYLCIYIYIYMRFT